jgi:hypothetical protein
MTKRIRNRDFFFLIILIVVMVGLPWAIQAYDDHQWLTKKPAGAKLFTLTAHSELMDMMQLPSTARAGLRKT